MVYIECAKPHDIDGLKGGQSMSIFLRLSERYRTALETFDPLRKEWFMRIVDPWPGGREDGKPPWSRIAVILLIYFGPIWLFSYIPSTTFGGRLLGKGGLAVDIGIYPVMFYNLFALGLIAITRRILGDLPNELAVRGIAQQSLRGFDPSSAPMGKILRFVERISRLNGWRGLVWYFIFVAWNICCYYFFFLAVGKPTWQDSPAEQGTFFYFLKVANMQPNLAGLWSFLVLNPLGNYSVVIIARLTIVFACLCSQLARSEKLSITPCHPDGAGGLQPLGQVTLLFSVLIFIVGIALLGMFVNELVLNFQSGHGSGSLRVFFGLWALYLLLGSLLFFLPLLPLRARMASAKRRYLLQLTGLRTAADLKHQTELQENDFRPDSVQKVAALDTLIRTASEMAVWPFDRKTFLRYTSLFIPPLTPLVAELVAHITGWLKAYLRLSM